MRNCPQQQITAATVASSNGTCKCSGDDSSPSSPGEGLAPWDATDTNVQRVALRPMAADCRRYSGVPPNIRNNVAALTQRHPAPARGWHRWTIQIRTYHGSGPAGRMAADCRRYTGFVHCGTVLVIRLRYFITGTGLARFSPGPGGNLRSVSGRTGIRHPGTSPCRGHRKAWPPGGH